MLPGSCPNCGKQLDLLSDIKFDEDLSIDCPFCNKCVFGTSYTKEPVCVIFKGTKPTYNGNYNQQKNKNKQNQISHHGSQFYD